MPFVYILRCADRTLYVGQTQNLEARERSHNHGTGSAYTSKRCPVRVVYWEEFAELSKAIHRERQLKRWSGKKKEALIAGDRVLLKQLSKRRGRHP